jgi:hypothetical protein
MEAEVYKVSVTDEQGNLLEAFVTAKGKDSYVRAMASEYGPVTVEPAAMEDLDPDMREALFPQQ